jgi:hypothetical protein
LAEHQNPVQALLLQLGTTPLAALQKFLFGEVKRHIKPPRRWQKARGHNLFPGAGSFGGN